MVHASDIANAWRRLNVGAMVFIARKDGEYLCEGPMERLDLGAPGPSTADEETESAIRVFFSAAECDEYCGIWKELLGVGPENQQVRTMVALLPDIWKHLQTIVVNSYADYTVPPRIELCSLIPGGYPTVIDTLFSEREEMN